MKNHILYLLENKLLSKNKLPWKTSALGFYKSKVIPPYGLFLDTTIHAVQYNFFIISVK